MRLEALAKHSAESRYKGTVGSNGTKAPIVPSRALMHPMIKHIVLIIGFLRHAAVGSDVQEPINGLFILP